MADFVKNTNIKNNTCNIHQYQYNYVAQKTQRSNAAVGPRMDRTQFLVQLRAPTTENRNVLQDNGDKNL